MKFDLMLHLSLSYEELHRIPLEELHWYYERLMEHLKEEAEMKKLELEIHLRAAGVSTGNQTSAPDEFTREPDVTTVARMRR